jgi:Domain of unknown function (DUF4124)
MCVAPCNTGRERARKHLRGSARQWAAPAALAFAFGALVVFPAWGALYKWTDANGRVVYSDQPPPGDVKVETISGPPPPANPNAVKELANKELDLKKQQTAAADNAKKAIQVKTDSERQVGACKEARGQLSALASDQVLLSKINEKGETVFIDEAERRQRRTSLETYIKANCPAG